MYRAVLIDPPWPEFGGGKIKRGAQAKYPLIRTKEEILSTIVRAEPWPCVEKDAHLWLWVTNNYLAWGLWLMGALGFRYITNCCWPKLDKKNSGLGQYLSGKHELCLFGVRGRLPANAPKAADTLILGPYRGHSVKPDETYEKVEKVSPGPYLEMFARPTSIRPAGWDCWGNEVPPWKPPELEATLPGLPGLSGLPKVLPP